MDSSAKFGILVGKLLGISGKYTYICPLFGYFNTKLGDSKLVLGNFNYFEGKFSRFFWEICKFFLGTGNLLFGLGNSNSSGKDFVLGELVMCENSSLGWEYGLVFDY